MAQAFNLTAQINLQGPSAAAIKPIVADIKRQLGSATVDVKIKIPPKAAASIDAVTKKLQAMNGVLSEAQLNANNLSSALSSLSSSFQNLNSNSSKTQSSVANTASSVKATSNTIKVASSRMEEFGKQSALAVKRFAAFSLTAGPIYALINAVNSAFKAFISFDKQLVKLQQVTGQGAIGIKDLEKTITNLSINLGVSSEGLIEVASTLAQAGLTADDTRIALAALAKTDLAPSFDDITETTEGAIAAIRQFGLETSDLEAVLGSINAVAAAFAVESRDIISAIQRTGGVFASASKGVSEGADALNEFIAVFTSVRATTRESAETIATGLRTIFTRIQRGSTIKQLKQFGIELTDLEGKFVGPYEAIKRLSEGLKSLSPRDLRFSQIVEELGGFRQIGKVIPLIQQFGEAQKALGVAQRGQGSLTEAQIKAQQSLANQLARVREQFLALIRDIGQSSVFQGLFKIVTSLTSGFISLAGAFKPILPILGLMGVVKGASALTQFASGFFGGVSKGGGAKQVGQSYGESISGAKEKERTEATSKAADAIRSNTDAIKSLTSAIESLEFSILDIYTAPPTTKNGGGKILAFARGGVVPGQGNRDTVPAMLQPGEFVIRKKAVETIGANRLHKMNKYAKGGPVKLKELAREDSSIESGYNNKIQSNDQVSASINRKQFNFDANQTSPINWKTLAKRIEERYQGGESYFRAQGHAFEESIVNLLGREAKRTADIANYGADYPIDIISGNKVAEVKFTKKIHDDNTYLSKLVRHHIQQQSLSKYPFTSKFDPDVGIGSIDVFEMASNAKDQFQKWYNTTWSQKKNIGGLIQKFAEGSPGGIRLPSGKGRGRKGKLGRRDRFISPTEGGLPGIEKYLDWAKQIYAEYDADPSLVKASYMGISMPPEIALADYLLAQYALETGGAGLRVGKEFVRVPADKITDELKKDLIPDPTDPTQMGFYKDKIARFLLKEKKTKSSQQSTTRGLKKTEGALTFSAAGLQRGPRAPAGQAALKLAEYEQDPEYRKEMGLDAAKIPFLQQFEKAAKTEQFLSPKALLEKFPQAKSQLEQLQSSIQTELSRTTDAKIQKSLTDQLRKVTTALSDFDNYIGGALPKNAGRASHFAWAMRQAVPGSAEFANGGLVQKFVDGGEPEPISTPRSITEIIKLVQELGTSSRIKSLIGIGKIIQEASAVGVRGVLPKRILDLDFLKSDKVTPFIPTIDKLLDLALIEDAKVKREDDFRLSPEEIASARPVGIVGFRSNLKDLMPYYRKRKGKNPMRVYTGILQPTDYADVEQLWREYYESQMKAAGNIASRRGQSAMSISEVDRKTFGIANAQGYDVEMILAALGSTGGKRSSQDAIDFASGLSPLAADVFGIPAGIPTQAKLTVTSDSITDAIDGIVKTFFFGGKVNPLAKKYGLSQKEFEQVQKLASAMGLDQAGLEQQVQRAAARKQKGKDIKFGLLDTQAELMASDTIRTQEEAALQEFMKAQGFAVGGAVKLYHGTTTGTNDSILKSFQEQGGMSGIAQGYGQGAGLFLYTDRDRAVKQAQMRVSGGGFGTVTSGDTSGRPMVVTFSEILDPKNFDLDYELEKGLIIKWLTSNYDQIKDKLNPTKDLGGIVDIITENRSQGIMSSGIVTKTASQGLKEIYAGSPSNITEGAIISQIISRLRTADPELVDAFESKLFEKPMGLVLKYIGESALRPISLEPFAKGGSAKDTVPALLTPGEFVINKQAAQKIGYSKLNKMNKADKIQGFNKGGAVGNIRRFFEGGKAEKDVERAQGEVIKDVSHALETVSEIISSLPAHIQQALKNTQIESLRPGQRLSLQGGSGPEFREGQRGVAVTSEAGSTAIGLK